MGTATLVKDLGHSRSGASQRLYRVDPPMRDDVEHAQYEHVVVSAVDAPYTGDETYIFGANENGEILNWSELDGSFRGAQDHEQALANAGYTVAK